jgi:hypothetical protein
MISTTILTAQLVFASVVNPTPAPGYMYCAAQPMVSSEETSVSSPKDIRKNLITPKQSRNNGSRIARTSPKELRSNLQTPINVSAQRFKAEPKAGSYPKDIRQNIID